MKNPTVAFHTLGCKLNFAETSTIARQLRDHGYQKTAFENVADMYVINTCSVTENADKECRMIVRKALNLNPSAFVAVIGCYAQLKPAEIAAIEGVDLVLGATEKFNIIQYLEQLDKKEMAEIHSCEIETADFFVSSFSLGDRTRAFLKVQDGCDYSCTYCTIPLARGSSRSDTIGQVIKQAKEIAAGGIKEIVLTGVNIGDFSPTLTHPEEKEKNQFLELLKALDDLHDDESNPGTGIERFRISSIEPNLLTNDIIEFVASSKKFVPHFHIPLQSGSDRILKLMRRRYLRDLYKERVEKITSQMPHCCIGADVIVGFPGESESDFLETYRFIQELDVAYLHVFTYSERDHTDAIRMSGIVPVNERRRRNKMLRILSEKKLQHFYHRHLGKPFTVLFESENKNGMIHGYTQNYIKVNHPFDESLMHQRMDVELTTINNDGTVSCELLKEAVYSYAF